MATEAKGGDFTSNLGRVYAVYTGGFLAFVILVIAVVILYFSLRKQLRKVDFDESALPAGVKPLPKYATKAEREKSAAAFEARRNAGPDTGDDQVAGS